MNGILKYLNFLASKFVIKLFQCGILRIMKKDDTQSGASPTCLKC